MTPTLRRPRSDWIMRRFMRGEDVDTIARSFLGPDANEDYSAVRRQVAFVEDAIRREMLKSEKRRKLVRIALNRKIEEMKERYR